MNEGVMGRNWYLVYTKPKNEEIVAFTLQSKGYKVLNTTLKERKYKRGKIKEVLSPLFPCYIFVKFDSTIDHKFIKYTRGVRKVVGGDNTPTIVPEEIISSIRSRENQGVITIRPPKFEQGEEVLIKDGPFKNYEAIFQEELKGIERVCIMLKAVNARMIVDSCILLKNYPARRMDVCQQ